MKSAYLPFGAALSLMMTLTPLASLVGARDGTGKNPSTWSAALQFAQDESTDSHSNSPMDQPEDSAATNENSDQSSAQPGDENSAPSDSGPSDENLGESAQMNSNNPDNAAADQSRPKSDNDQ